MKEILGDSNGIRTVITKVEPYADVSPSDISGLSHVPAHWKVCKLRQVLSPVAERDRPDLPLLSVVRERGVVLRNTESKEENHNFIPDDLSNYKVVWAGQFAMNKMKAWQGSYGVSRHDGIVSPAYFTFDVNGVSGDYFHLAIRSKAYVPFFTQASDGVRVGQWDLSQARMKEIPFLIPPPEEQAAIVKFVNHADRRLRLEIRRLEKEIELLREYRASLIADAVIGRIDVREAAAKLPEFVYTEISGEVLDAAGDDEASLDEAFANDEAM